MHSKLITSIIIINLSLMIFIPISVPAQNKLWWDDNWSYRQEIIIPFDTNLDIAKYQPIDIFIEFENSCYAKNEQEHSIRVIYQTSSTFIELDCQIYNLNHVDNTHIDSCGLVYIIPEEANGLEQYFVYYDESEKLSPNYVDHVGIEESYYRYEPISGYPLTSHYYKITQDEYIIYAISQEGELMGYHTSQHVTKLKEKTTEVMPEKGELFAAFCFQYFYGDGPFDYSSSSQVLLSKEILIDGNLMVEFGLESTSDTKDILTTASYKYYYNPSENTRIHAHVKHEVLKELYVEIPCNTDGSYAILQCGGITSTSISELNFGEILPFIHLYNENGIIDEYRLDPDPDYIPDDPDIPVLATEDDVDAGEKTWASYDYGETGVSHSVIFASDNVLQSGADERDGVQIKAYEIDYPHLPGIENNMATLLFTRNSLEKGGVQDGVIPDDFVAEFDAEFFSSKTGGYKIISEESDIYKSLVKLKPLYESRFEEDTEKTEEYNLTVYAHIARSIPFGSALSALIGRNFSYISAELYKDDEFIISGAMGRLLLKPLPDLSEANLVEQIVTVLSSFDYRNLTFAKKFYFENLEPGRYVVKIYKVNNILGRDKRYIGYQIVNVNEDIKTRVVCRPEGLIQVSVLDQYEKAVSDADIVLLDNDVIISSGITDEQGNAIISAPVNLLKSYGLKVFYNGLTVYDDVVRLPFSRIFIPLRKTVDIQRYDFTVKVVDKWGLIPEFKLNPMLLNNQDDEQIKISADSISDDRYVFSDVPPDSYQLSIQYKSFTFDKDITIPSEDVEVVFPAEFLIKLNIMDTRGDELEGARVVVSRGGIDVEMQSNLSGAMFILPPGVYNVKVYSQDDIIGARKIDVFSQRSFDIITTSEPVFPIYFIILAIILTIIGVIFSFIKKDYTFLLKLVAVSLIIISIVSPWWMLQGADLGVETSTTMYLTPLQLITQTTTSEVISGELAFLPELFIDIVSLIPIITFVASILIFSSMFLRNRKKRIYLLLLFLVLFMFAGSMLIFTVGMNELAKVGIGGFIGNGNLDVSIPGEEMVATVSCSWGPNIGFYIYLAAIIITTIIIVFNVKKIFKKKN